MPKDALTDADGRDVFVRDDGSYATEYPEENVVRRGDGADLTVFEVFAFVGEAGDYEEQSWRFTDEDEAREFATEVYGADVSAVHVHDHASPPHKAARRFDRDGEVFTVEVHERPEEYVSVPRHRLQELISKAINDEQLVNGEWPGDSHRSSSLGRTIQKHMDSVEE